MKSSPGKTSKFAKKFNARAEDMRCFPEDSPEYGELDSAAFMRMVRDAGSRFARAGRGPKRNPKTKRI